jgi:hypothetical protein
LALLDEATGQTYNYKMARKIGMVRNSRWKLFVKKLKLYNEVKLNF